MKVIPREAGRITYSAEIRCLKKIDFSEYQKAVIVGSILGDGCLCENWSKTNYRLIISHSVGQNEYIEWKYQVLKQWILTRPRFYEKNRSLTIRTISHPTLTILQEVFYENNKKIIPKYIFKLIKNPLTVAVWFMDDGNVIKRNGKVIGYHLNTQSFTKLENTMLAEAFQACYGIDPVLERNHGRYRLCFAKKSSYSVLAEVIRPYVLKSLSYKLG
jgi:hypothetical protein